MLKLSLLKLNQKISSVGYSSGLKKYEKRRVIVFNQLNFWAFVFSVLRLIYIFLKTPIIFSYSTFLINACLTFVFLVMMLLMHKRYFKIATISSFLIVPPLFALMCWVTKDEGLDMFVIIYMLFCFFFLHRLRNSLIAFCYCFIVFIIIHFWLEKEIGMAENNTPQFVLTVSNYLFAFFMFVATLSLIKHQVWAYEKSIKQKTKLLNDKSIQIEIKNETLKLQADNLEAKSEELIGLNKVKNKLFSVISHDVRTSIYAFKNILDAYRLGYISKEELVTEIPELSNEIDNCTEVMDNLLNWGKDQFKEKSISPEMLGVKIIVEELYKQVKGRIDKKAILFLNNVTSNCHVFADRHMLQIVLRNLISNAVKFTPQGGKIEITTKEDVDYTSISVADNGVGMPSHILNKIVKGNSISTQGTSAELGTGLGLIICKDFIQENNGKFLIESEDGKGSVFKIILPNKYQS